MKRLAILRSTLNQLFQQKMSIRYVLVVKDNAFLFKVLFSGNYPDFEVDYVKCVSKYMNNNLLANQNIYESIFITAGCLHISKYWLDNGCIQPASEVAEQLLKIISKHL